MLELKIKKYVQVHKGVHNLNVHSYSSRSNNSLHQYTRTSNDFEYVVIVLNNISRFTEYCCKGVCADVSNLIVNTVTRWRGMKKRMFRENED